jgi:peptidoglycan biosynthesis protein MviN/MurJ (putative lipid II flippase)
LSEHSVGRRIARAMVTIFIFQIFWKFGGFIVKTLVFRQFAPAGQEHVLDAYFFAEATFIWTLYVVFDKTIFPTFIPLFSDELERRGEADAWRFARTFVNALVLSLLAVVTACMIWTPDVVHFIASGWVAEHRDTAELALRFCRWMLPAVFFVSLGSFTHALLNANKRFGHAAAGMGMHRFVHAAIFFIAFPALGYVAKKTALLPDDYQTPVIWAALAFALAAPAKVLTHLHGLRDKLRHWRPTIPYWRPILRGTAISVAGCAVLVAASGWIGAHAGIGPAPDGANPFVAFYHAAFGGAGVGPQILIALLLWFLTVGAVYWFVLGVRADKTIMQRLYLLAYPVLIGVVIARVRDLVQDGFATHLEDEGVFGAIKYAKSVGEFPTAIIPLALSMAMFPYLCDMFTKQDLKGLSAVVSRAIKMIVLFFLPLTIITVILREPVIELLASRKGSDVVIDATALALALYALGFIFYAAEMVMMQTCFSLQNTWLPTLIGALASFGQVGFIYVAFRAVRDPNSEIGTWLAGWGMTPLIVVAVAYPLSRAAKNLVLGLILHVRLRLVHVRDLVRFVPQVALVTGYVGAAARVWRPVGELAQAVATRALIQWGGPFAATVELSKEATGLAEDTVVATGEFSTLTALIGRGLGLAVPAAAALIGFLLMLVLLKELRWPVEEFEFIVQWLRGQGLAKIRAKLGRK